MPEGPLPLRLLPQRSPFLPPHHRAWTWELRLGSLMLFSRSFPPLLSKTSSDESVIMDAHLHHPVLAASVFRALAGASFPLQHQSCPDSWGFRIHRDALMSSSWPPGPHPDSETRAARDVTSFSAWSLRSFSLLSHVISTWKPLALQLSGTHCPHAGLITVTVTRVWPRHTP